jgi:hypothetical protein
MTILFYALCFLPLDLSSILLEKDQLMSGMLKMESQQDVLKIVLIVILLALLWTNNTEN